jgi:CRISPR-associated protein Cmr1
MQDVTFDVQTITPLFLAGADQATAELRAPSFRTRE